MTASRTRATRSGRRRPCSQACKAVTSRPKARECGLREAQPVAQLGHVHAFGHRHSIARQFQLTARMSESIVQARHQATCEGATIAAMILHACPSMGGRKYGRRVAAEDRDPAMVSLAPATPV